MSEVLWVTANWCLKYPSWAAHSFLWVLFQKVTNLLSPTKTNKKKWVQQEDEYICVNVTQIEDRKTDDIVGNIGSHN